MAHVATKADGTVYLADDWHIEDVRQQGIDDGVELTDEQCIQVLHALADNFDANIGISWDVISFHISNL